MAVADAVEQVAAAELRPQPGPGLGPRDEVEAEPVAEREDRAALAVDERERFGEPVDPRPLRVVDVG